MNRIDHIFTDLKADGRKALMPFITAGDGGLDTTAAVIPALEKGGASICEVGIPFSDPIADGPVIQASMTRALDAGVKVGQVFETVAGIRAKTELGLVAMVSYSIVYRMGVKAFMADAKQAGFDGFGPMSAFIRMTPPGWTLDPATSRVRSFLDDVPCQDGSVEAMIFPIPELIAVISECMTLNPGDLIFTGTPEGVTPIAPGQVVRIEAGGGFALAPVLTTLT